MKQLCLTLVITFLLIISCKDEEKPKVIYTEEHTAEQLTPQKDTTRVEIADIPIHIDSTSYLLHPIGTYQIYAAGRKVYFGTSKANRTNFNISSDNGRSISGRLHNLKFQQLNSTSLVPLTDKTLIINQVSFLRMIFETTKKQYLIYKVIDNDTNRDGTLDSDDIETLYISNIDGSDFTKLIPKNQELLDWEVIKIANRLYFRSIEDTNKNGEFDRSDQVHYRYLDFSTDRWELSEYSPIE